MSPSPTPLLQVEQLRIAFADEVVVDDLNMTLHAGKTLALVGESGSGKSLSALSIMGLLPDTASWQATRMQLVDDNLLSYTPRQWQGLRGGRVGMIFQEPLTALNPLHTVEKQISESLFVHQGLSKHGARQRCLALLKDVELPATTDMLGRFPHQLSGGQRQRVMIAMALANDPALLIADEPTTALDVTVQETILRLLKRLQQQRNLAVLLISHDLGVVSRVADHLVVMHQGKTVESGPTSQVLAQPKADYTRHLINAEPHGRANPLPADTSTVLEGKAISVNFKQTRQSLFRPPPVFKAVDRIDLQLKHGETLGIVGESGSGKSTLALALLRLIESNGDLMLDGINLRNVSQGQLRPLRKHFQVVFQDPFGSLNPRMTIGQIIEEGLGVHYPALTSGERVDKVSAILQEVGLPVTSRDRYPHEFSGGQRQRVAIARALVLDPKVLILDEPTSALDRSVQHQVLELLKDLQRKHGLSYVFISHDLKVIRAICHRVMVMKDGEVVEQGPCDDLFTQPRHPYTQALLQAAFADTLVTMD